MKHKKPTGNKGSINFTRDEDKSSLSWQKIRFPTDKVEIEKVFCDWYLKKLRDSGLRDISVVKNEENDFDFTMKLPFGEVYLDLAEIVLGSQKYSPYENKSKKVDNAQFASAVVKIVDVKSIKYSALSRVPIHLLLYTTHWRFMPSDVLIRLLQYDLNRTNHRFDSICLICPLGTDDSLLWTLYPAPRSNLTGIDFESIRKQSYYVLDPGDFHIEQSD